MKKQSIKTALILGVFAVGLPACGMTTWTGQTSAQAVRLTEAVGLGLQGQAKRLEALMEGEYLVSIADAVAQDKLGIAYRLSYGAMPICCV